MGTVSSATATFNGSSSYAAQLQQTISTAVKRASAPIQQLQTEQSSLEGQQGELGALSGEFQSVQSALNAIGTASAADAYSANASDSSVATATAAAGTMAGIYSITVSSVGTQTTAISGNGLTAVTNPTASNIDSSTTYTLTVNGQQYSISNPGNSLMGLAEAINASGANVQATVVNVGGSSQPDYRLSLQSGEYGPDTIQLNDGSKDLLDTLTPGSYVEYEINGQSDAINSTSRTVTISPGLTATFLQPGSTSITVAKNVNNISDALSSFATAYNSAAAELEKNRGQNGGALSGQSIVYELQGALENIASYAQGGGAVTSLSDLGLTFDESGNLNFDPSAFAAVSASDASGVLTFLGSANGTGFLGSAANILTSVNDSTNGLISQGNQSLSNEITDLARKISDGEAQVSQLQQTLTTQMANADATIASMQSQVTEMTTLFGDMQQYYRQSNG